MNLPHEALTTVLVAVVTLFFIGTAMLVKPAYDLLKTNVKASVFDFLKEKAKTFVSDLAQDPAWSGLAGAEKKERAILWLTDYCKQNGFPMDYELAGKLVEEAYLGIKKLVKVADTVLE